MPFITIAKIEYIWTATKIKKEYIINRSKPGNRIPFQQTPSLADDCKQAEHDDYKYFNKKDHILNRGHLIAASYGRESREHFLNIFHYVNTVPQYATFNSPVWSEQGEQRLIEWASKQCTGKNNGRTDLYIVVGTIPSQNKFYGKGNDRKSYGTEKDTCISENQDDTYYRINVPEYMWTAACCENKVINKMVSFAFYGENKEYGTDTDKKLVVNAVVVKAWLGSYDIKPFPGTTCFN